jgi:hypothetical protein
MLCFNVVFVDHTHVVHACTHLHVQGPKQRKAVDRRASKGRRLRYHVHDKLVSFMAPVELDAPQFAPQLFSHLFGGGGAK